ncbi:MAG: hypothetical protein M3547_01065 [Acidobacteriota bacterium]|nr:hypothetical protein [Acidobacteriota bacterium]
MEAQAGTALKRQGGNLARATTAADLIARRELILQVMKEVMVKDVDYGKIPGTPKNSLWKPGAEKLSSVFHIAVKTEVADCDEADGEIKYRVRATATAIATEEFLGEDEGVCSSLEKKYRWRRPVVAEEWDATPADRRCEVWKKDDQGKGRQEKLVRQDPEDLRNTLLQMADKRAFVAVIRKVTGASDVFSMDAEDLPEGTVTERKGAYRKKPERASSAAKTDGGKAAKPAAPAAVEKASPAATDTPAEPAAAAEPEIPTQEIAEAGPVPVVVLGAFVAKKLEKGNLYVISISLPSGVKRDLTTFNESQFKIAKSAHEEGKRIQVDWMEETKGDRTYYNIATIAKVDAAAA